MVFNPSIGPRLLLSYGKFANTRSKAIALCSIGSVIIAVGSTNLQRECECEHEYESDQKQHVIADDTDRPTDNTTTNRGQGYLKQENGKTIINESSKKKWWSFYTMFQTEDSLSKLQKSLPRPLQAKDVAFNWTELREGLQKRAEDEQKLLSLQEDAQQLFMRTRQNRGDKSEDRKKMLKLADQIAQIAYGKGVTAEMRQNYLIKYGCAAWTDEVIDEFIRIGQDRGFVECGAGNGQWARHLNNRQLLLQPNSKGSEFVLAFDDFSSLPLNPQAYIQHRGVQESFYHNVREGDATTIFCNSNKMSSAYGRILVIIYPSASVMARETLAAYMNQGAKNDYFVYIGEGRGGANADNSFFDMLEESDGDSRWVLERVYHLYPIGNGFERAFFFRRTKIK